MSKKLTSIRIDGEIMKDFILAYIKYEQSLSNVLGVPRNSGISSLNTTELVHLSLKSATEFYQGKTVELLEKHSGGAGND